MKRDTAISIIKLIAIGVVFLGVILLSIVFIQLQNVNSMIQNMPGQTEMFRNNISNIGRFGYTTPIIIIIWGILLYVLNRPLSFLITED